MSALRLNNYPALQSPPLPGQLRAGAHCDYGSLTVLMPHQSTSSASGGSGSGGGGGGCTGDGGAGDGAGAGAGAAQGLQVFSQGGWKTVDVPAGTMVINIGDLMARWTNDRWQSTLHRVVVPPPPLQPPPTTGGATGAGAGDTTAAHRRMSLAFFHQPDWDAVIDVVPSCVGAGATPHYPPTTAGKHIKAKFEAAGIEV